MIDISIIKQHSISEVVGRYVKLKRAGSSYKGNCPFHNERTPSFMVSDAKGIFKCFGCDVSGDVIDFIQRIERTDFKGAVKILTGGEDYSEFTPVPPPPPKPIFHIPKERLTSHYKEYTGCTLYAFFCSLFPEKIVHHVFRRYNVMTGWDGLNVFPQVDINGNFRQVKELTADAATGKRDKEKIPLVNGIKLLSENEKNGYKLEQCFFGEHLIPDFTQIVIVESEKTALGMTIADLFYNGSNGRLWLATGGKSGINMHKRETLVPLKEKQVLLMPDNDAVEDWQRFKFSIAKVVEHVILIDSLASNENAAGKTKYDIWDYTLDAMNEARDYPATWDQPCERNPENDYWRLVNWACELEAAKVSKDFAKGGAILAEMAAKGFNEMPDDILEQYAPTLFSQMGLSA